MEIEILERGMIMESSNKRKKSLVGIYVLLLIYIILPRISIIDNSLFSVLFVNLKHFFPSVISVIIILLNRYQVKYDKHPKINLNYSVVILYSLYLFVNLLQLVIISL